MYTDFKDYLQQKDQEWELLCIRCGSCCGAFDDPCVHLKKNNERQYYCAIYPQRFGPRITINGDKFNCVPIREILHSHWKNDHFCVYKQKQMWTGL